MSKPLDPEVIIPAKSGSGRGTTIDGLEWIAWLMDRAIPIPGTKFTVGLDALLGLVPVGGDLLAGLVQTGLVLTVLSRHRVPKAVAARMAANVLLDIGVGAIPFVGDLFDVAFKANTRNLQLLREVRDHERQGRVIPAGPSVRYIVGIGAVLVGALLLVLAGFVAMATWIVKAIWNS